MKKSWIITFILCLLLLGGGCVAAFLPRTVPFYKCSDEYKKYSRVDGVEASFIKDFRINDTLTVDVTMLKAVDSIVLHRLIEQETFGNPSLRLRYQNPSGCLLTKNLQWRRPHYLQVYLCKRHNTQSILRPKDKGNYSNITP